MPVLAVFNSIDFVCSCQPVDTQSTKSKFGSYFKHRETVAKDSNEIAGSSFQMCQSDVNPSSGAGTPTEMCRDMDEVKRLPSLGSRTIVLRQ